MFDQSEHGFAQVSRPGGGDHLVAPHLEGTASLRVCDPLVDEVPAFGRRARDAVQPARPDDHRVIGPGREGGMFPGQTGDSVHLQRGGGIVLPVRGAFLPPENVVAAEGDEAASGLVAGGRKVPDGDAVDPERLQRFRFAFRNVVEGGRIDDDVGPQIRDGGPNGFGYGDVEGGFVVWVDLVLRPVPQDVAAQLSRFSDEKDLHRACGFPRRGYARSRSETIGSGKGHSIPSAGSSHRTPRACSGE